MAASPPPGAVRAVVFDLDGTLVDSRADIVASARFALKVHGEPDRADADIARHVGDGARALVAGTLGAPLGSARVDPVLATFLDYYTAHPIDHTVPMPGALETLRALAALPLAICTNKPRRVTVALLDAMDLSRYFALVVAGDDLPGKKPDPAPLRHITAHLGVDPTALAMVGDGVQDVRAGRAAGAFTVAITGGFTTRAALEAEGPDAIVDRLDAIVPLVLPALRHPTSA